MSGQPSSQSDGPNTCLLLVILPIAALLCIGGVVGINWVTSLPDRAQETFGTAAGGLGTIEHYIISARLIQGEAWLTQPGGNPTAPTDFSIEFGENAYQVVARLYEEDIIDNRDLFSTYLQYRGLDTSIQAGNYRFTPAMSPIQIAHELQDATPAEVTFRVLPGWRMEEIAASLPTSGLDITPNQFLITARNDPQNYAIEVLLPTSASLEGFMAPGEYEIPRIASVEDLITTLVDNFVQQLDEEIMQGFAEQGLSLYEAVTLASVVEREAVVISEAPRIASVYINRLAIGMKLEADPTVQYSLGYNRSSQTWWTNPLSLADLEVDSPYNTYRYPGLTPGPIANPSLEAIRAVAFPDESPFYFFRAACDGSGLHDFSITFEEHLAKGCEGVN